jgi:hypothetical protein
MKRVISVAILFGLCTMRAMFAAPPAFVDITWMSISNMYYELGPLNIVTDGYITRLPQHMDKWRFDRNGVRPVPNTEVKKALGFN